MKIAIISDSHSNEKNLRKLLRYCSDKKIETIIHCGDMASLEMMNVLNDNFNGVAHYTFGNADYDDLRDLESQKKYKKTFIYKNHGEVEIEEKKIAFVHFPEIARKLTESGKYDFVFYGHTHQPWEQHFGKCKMLNPGTLAGEIYLPTFAVWNTKNNKFKLIRVDELK
ncbi:MAG: YfcE family phosphodiesterase [Patescibacteria group bacterium]|jgi:putative phosphoesterase|nr:YfcE family phosphodiesterase [Patescibacteria group bacterium]